MMSLSEAPTSRILSWSSNKMEKGNTCKHRRQFFKVKSFQTAHQKLQKLSRFKDNENIFFASRNDLAFVVSDV
jgi:hypothetical protein